MSLKITRAALLILLALVAGCSPDFDSYVASESKIRTA